MSRRRGYKRYSAEFKREALKRASEDGMTDKVVCEELGISARQLARWRDELRLLGDDAFLGKGQTGNEELTRLKRELAKVKQERDFSYGPFLQEGRKHSSRYAIPFPTYSIIR